MLRTSATEPDYAIAWTGPAYAYLDEVRDGFNFRPAEYDALARALEYARRSVALAPDSAKAHEALYTTHFIRNELPAFVEVGERALALNPNDVDTLADFGFKLAISGHWDRGMVLLEQAIVLNPVHPAWWRFAIVLNHYRRADYEASLRESLAIDMPGYYMTHVFQAINYGQLGQIEGAERAIGEVARLKPDFASTVHQDFGRRNVPVSLIEHIVDGLAKAGLIPVPEA